MIQNFNSKLFALLGNSLVMILQHIEKNLTLLEIGNQMCDATEENICVAELHSMKFDPPQLTLILRRSRTGTVWFYTSTSKKRAAWPKLYTKSLTRDLKLTYRRLILVRIFINLYTPCVLYIGTGVSLIFRERFLYI